MIWVEIWRRSIFKPNKTFLDIFTHFHNERNIFKPKATFLHLFTHADIPRTPSPMSSHQLHCQDYRDNVYIFTYTFYLYVLRTIKHPKRIRFTYTFCVQLDVLNTVPFQCTPLWPDLLIRLIPLYVYVLLIRLTSLPLWSAPLTPYTYTFNLYILRIRYTYTYYIYFILTCNTYIFYLQLNVEFPSFFSNFLRNFYSSNFSQNILPLFFSKIFLRQFFPKYLHRADS